MSLLRRVDVKYADSPNLDAFGRLRVSQPIFLFDCQFTYDTAPLLWDDITTTGGTVSHLPNEGSVLLSVDTTSGASVIRQTKAYHRYQPGKSHFVEATFVFGDAVSNVAKWVGYGDTNNGFFVRQNDDGTIDLVYRTFISGSAVDTVVSQSDWNLDTFGAGTLNPSSTTIDFTLSQNFIIDLQALYVGRVRVGFVVDGLVSYAHEFKFANVLSTAFIQTANLPVRYQITATGVAGGAATMRQVCCSVNTEGGVVSERGLQMNADTGVTTSRNFGTTPLPVLAVRPKSTFNSIANKGQLRIEGIDLLPVSGSQAFRWRILYNPTITGGSWVSADASSIAEYNITGTALTGGIPISAGFLDASNTVRFQQQIMEQVLRYPWCVDAAGTQIVICIEATDFSGTTDLCAAMQWRELR